MEFSLLKHECSYDLDHIRCIFSAHPLISFYNRKDPFRIKQPVYSPGYKGENTFATTTQSATE